MLINTNEDLKLICLRDDILDSPMAMYLIFK